MVVRFFAVVLSVILWDRTEKSQTDSLAGLSLRDRKTECLI